MATAARPPYRLGSVAATAVAVQGIGQKRERHEPLIITPGRMTLLDFVLFFLPERPPYSLLLLPPFASLCQFNSVLSERAIHLEL